MVSEEQHAGEGVTLPAPTVWPMVLAVGVTLGAAGVVTPSPRGVVRLRAGEATHRLRLPVEIYPYSSGLKAGIAGGIAMAAVAGLAGLIVYGSVWYPINLLAAAGSEALTRASEAQLKAFNFTGFVLGLVVHGVLSVL